ncbi:MAG: VanZ family protein [Thiothrix sp.]|uniref:VanZ family protein n=1 Tax=Thiothrix sp. TaxID=1032 RepID=UPI0026394938|nr:VanZ family protein [Thiothrix sp.]MDD5393501.1 VanZ family protein [Thiothrix sp.]
MQAILSRLLAIQPPTRRVVKIVFLCLMAIGLVLALLPMDGMGLEFNNRDKLAHAAAFFGFAFLLDLATLRSFWYWKAPLLLSYGAVIEILQAFTPWRSFSVADWAADALGILLYWLVWRGLTHYATAADKP